jgi:hypothetical protein
MAPGFDLVVGVLRSIRDSDAEIGHIRSVLKKKVTHNVGDHMMADGQ